MSFSDRSVKSKMWCMSEEGSKTGDLESPNVERSFLQESVIEVEAFLGDQIDRAIEEGMEEHPDLAAYVVRKMGETLTLQERLLVGETCLVVYKACRAIPPEKVVDPEVAGTSRSVATMIAVSEDEIPMVGTGSNAIYETIQSGMDDAPELALHITDAMKKSVSLEESIIVGEAAYVVYDVMEQIRYQAGLSSQV